MIELRGKLRVVALDWKQSSYDGRSYGTPDGRSQSGGCLGPLLAGFPSTLDRGGVEASVLSKWSIEGEPRLAAPRFLLAPGRDFRIAGVKQLVLEEHCCVAMDDIGSGARYHVDHPTSGTTELGAVEWTAFLRQPVNL
jgi:hypothetical protein